MTEVERKFGSDLPCLADLCKLCGKTWGEHAGSICPRELNVKVERPVATQLERIEQSQGKLLAALNEHDEWAKSTHVKANQMLADSKAENEKERLGRIEAVEKMADLLFGLSAKLDGIRDGLAAEIAKLCDEVSDLRPVVLPLTCGDCGRDFDHCKCKVFAMHNPYEQPRRAAKRRKK